MLVDSYYFLVALLKENAAAFVAFFFGFVLALILRWFKEWLRFRNPTKELAATKKKLLKSVQIQDQLQADLALSKQEVEQFRDEAGRYEALLSVIHEEDQSVWTRSTALGLELPQFLERPERQSVIISIFNLKGGVGKTTLTANLGALWSQSAKVLLVDLDYQQSLTIACVQEGVSEIEAQEHGVERLWRSQNGINQLHSLWVGVENLPNLKLLGTGSGLSHVEASSMLRWLSQESKDDVRFRLRQALHDRKISFDVILIDCPPRLTTASVNALAASDFVIIPTLPDSRSGEAAIRVMNEIETLKAKVPQAFAKLRVLGIACNRKSSSFPAVEQQAWSAICESSLQKHVKPFTTMLRQFTAPARAEIFQSLHKDHRDEYENLIAEIKTRIL